MRFRVDQALPGSVEEVVAAFTDPGFLASLAQAAKVGAPEVLDQHRDGDVVRQRVRYRFTGELSPAVTRVVDRSRFVWIDEHTYDVAAGTAEFKIVPEHFGNRLTGGGTERYEADGDGCVRRVDAELKVRWPLVGGLVEQEIVSGLREHLAEEAELLRAWLRR